MLEAKAFRRAVYASVVAGCMAFTGVVQAGHGDVTLRYSPHELDSANGISALYKRIEQRAESHCVTQGRQPLRTAVIERACMRDVMNDLVAKIDNAQLSNLHRDLTSPLVADR